MDAASLELAPVYNITGRQANRGMESLAITRDGRMLVGMMQNALIQDNGLNVVTVPNVVPGRRGLNNRIVTIDLPTGETHEYVYVLEAAIDGAAAGIHYEPQQLPAPLYAPGQVKKALK